MLLVVVGCLHNRCILPCFIYQKFGYDGLCCSLKDTLYFIDMDVFLQQKLRSVRVKVAYRSFQRVINSTAITNRQMGASFGENGHPKLRLCICMVISVSD